MVHIEVLAKIMKVDVWFYKEYMKVAAVTERLESDLPSLE